MSVFELPIKITEREGLYSIAMAISDTVVVSRQLTRADMVQLQVLLDQVLSPQTGVLVDDEIVDFTAE